MIKGRQHKKAMSYDFINTEDEIEKILKKVKKIYQFENKMETKCKGIRNRSGIKIYNEELYDRD